MPFIHDNPAISVQPANANAWQRMVRELSKAISQALAGPVNLLIDGLVKFKFLITSTPTTEFVIYSSQTGSPYANAFIRWREPDGTTKAVLGFTAAADDTFSITSYEDHRLKFRTGKVGDPTDFTNRAIMYGNATSSWIGVVSANTATELGGCFVRFTESDDSITKGYVGYTSTTDDDLDIENTVANADVTLKTAGTGDVIALPAGTEAFRVKDLGQVRFQPLAADPATLQDGDVWYNSTAVKLRVRAGGVTIDLH